MDSITRNKRLGWVVLLLVVMNIVSLSALWIGYTKRPGREMPGKGGDKFLEQKLELRPEQTEKLKALRVSHFNKMEDLKREFRESRKGLHEFWKVENGAAQGKGLAEKIGRLQADIELEIFAHFSDIREICDDKQKQVFDSIIEDVLQGGMRREGPGGNRPPPRQGRGPGGNLPPPDGR